jgi:hypothetical protein
METKIAGAQSFECGAIGSDDVGIERFGRRNEPGVILVQSARCPALHYRAPSCLAEMQSLNCESLQ